MTQVFGKLWPQDRQLSVRPESFDEISGASTVSTVHGRPSHGTYVGKPEGASTQDLRSLVPNTIEGMVLETRSLKYWVLGPSTSQGLTKIQSSASPSRLEAQPETAAGLVVLASILA